MFTSLTALQHSKTPSAPVTHEKQHQTGQTCPETIHGQLESATGRTAHLPATEQHSGGMR